MNLLALLPWPYRILGLALLAAAIWGHGWMTRGNREQAKFAAFEAAVRAEGRAAQKLAEARIATEITRKVESDAKYKTASANLRATTERLRDARSRVDYLPAPASGAGSPDRACFDRAELERAIRSLDTGVSGLVAEGDEVALRLKLAVEWAR